MGELGMREKCSRCIATDESVQLEGQALSLHSSLQEALVRVRDEEVVPVEENGQYIGALTSRHIVNYIVEQIKERG